MSSILSAFRCCSDGSPAAAARCRNRHRSFSSIAFYYLSVLIIIIINCTTSSCGVDLSIAKILYPDDTIESSVAAAAAADAVDIDIGEWHQIPVNMATGNTTDANFRPLVASSFLNISLPSLLQPTLKKAFACDKKCGLAYDSKKGNDDGDDDEEEDRIIGGERVTPNRYPWIAELLILVPDFFKPKKFRCAAFIIKKQFLLTAAHCVYHTRVTSIQALMGFHYLDTTSFPKTGHEQVIPVAQIFIHDGFDPVTMEHDVAVLELVKPVVFSDQVHAICLPSDKAKTPKAGTNAIVAGWGLTEAYGTKVMPQMLLSTTLSIVDKKQCRRALSKYLTAHSICAGGPAFANKDPCTGDSGGPLMVKTGGGGRHVAYGVVSWGVECGRSSLPGVYVKVSTHLLWIQRITARRDDCSPTL